ncbi:TonB-dependent receptor [Methylibium sp.]|uniref:TonB-dependent receptor n=1 Tax=Methylibium sp. TaxID=2067992 RepID=UPI003D09E19F
MMLSLLGFACGIVRAQSSPAVEAGKLPPVLVTASRFAEDSATLPFGVSVLTAKDIAESGVSTVNEAVMKLLGVPGRLDLYGGGDYALDLRGFGVTSDNNQVVILDGIRINEADLGGTRLAGIPINAVERIEVLRGSGTVLYGEGATGGVIVITTKAGHGSSRSNQASVYAAAGSDRLRDLRADATLEAGGFSLDAAANRRTTDNHRDNFRSEVEGASLTGQWRNDWLRVGVRHAHDDLDTGLPGALTAAQYAADPSQTNTPNDHATIRNTRTGVFAEADLGGDWQLGLDAGWRDKELRSSSFGSSYDYDVDAKSYSLRVRHRTQFASVVNAVVFGVDRGEWERTVLGAFGTVGEQSSTGFYVKDDLTLGGGTRFSAGVRTERIEKDLSTSADRIGDRQRAWELGVLQPLSENASVYGRVGRSFRLANVDEFSFTNPAVPLQPQTSHDTELGVRWRAAGSSAELRAYRSSLKNEIGFDPNGVGPFGPFGANVNFDPTRRQGLELELAQALTGALNLRVNGVLRQARFTEGPYDGKDVPLTAKRTLSLRADWAPAPAHKLDAIIGYVSSQSPDFANVCSIPGRTTADLRYAYRWTQAEFALGVVNLTDRKYYTQAFGCTAGGETTSIYPEAGRAVVASVRVSF